MSVIRKDQSISVTELALHLTICVADVTGLAYIANVCALPYPSNHLQFSGECQLIAHSPHL